MPEDDNTTRAHDPLTCVCCAALEAATHLLDCGHPANCQQGDEHGHATCLVCALVDGKEALLRDAFRAGARFTRTSNPGEDVTVARLLGKETH